MCDVSSGDSTVLRVKRVSTRREARQQTTDKKRILLSRGPNVAPVLVSLPFLY